MSNKMKDILGLGPIDKDRKIPGTSFTEDREYRYIRCDDDTDVAVLFKKVIREVDPPLVAKGGAMNEECKVTLPSGDCYFALSYKGDVEGWRKQVEQGAVALGLSVAKVGRDKLLLSDGSEVLLSNCKFQFD